MLNLNVDEESQFKATKSIFGTQLKYFITIKLKY